MNFDNPLKLTFRIGNLFSHQRLYGDYIQDIKLLKLKNKWVGNSVYIGILGNQM